MATDAELDAANKDGFSACRSGLASSSNPHFAVGPNYNQELGFAWEQGFNAAQQSPDSEWKRLEPESSSGKERTVPMGMRIVSVAFAAPAGVLVGQHYGAYFLGASGAALFAAGFGWLGWLLGARVYVALKLIKVTAIRVAVTVVAILAWIALMSMLGIVASAVANSR